MVGEFAQKSLARASRVAGSRGRPPTVGPRVESIFSNRRSLSTRETRCDPCREGAGEGESDAHR